MSVKQPTSGQKFRIILLNAMTRPLAAAVVAITIVVGLNVGYWFFLVGLAFYIVIVAFTLRDVQESRKVLDEVLYPERVRKIDLNKLQGGYRAAMQRALDTRKKIEQAVIGTGDPAIRRALADSTQDMEDLTSSIYDIALKAQSLQNAVGSSNADPAALQLDIDRLKKVIPTSKDEFTREQYQSTLEGKQQQLKNINDTSEALDRWHAQLDNALSTLDTIFSQVLRIRSSEVLSLSTATDEVSNSLREEVDALKATSDALDAVYGLTN